jgi:hypothetical protein
MKIVRLKIIEYNSIKFRPAHMGDAESKMIAYIKLRHEEGALAITASEILGAIIPLDQPELRHRPAYRYGLERLGRRGIVGALQDKAGTYYYFSKDIGLEKYRELRDRLGV